MKILMTGATGLVGSALVEFWQDQHQLTVFTRNIAKARKRFGNRVEYIDNLTDIDLNSIEAVINLAGEPIADGRWTERRKRVICESRWQLTEQLASLILQAKTPPKVLINASAIGFYGRQSDERIDEDFSSFYPEFSHDVCAKWENLANRCRSEKTRVCILRIGIVLAAKGGALAKMLPAFRFGLGGKIASGEQMMSWIHLADLVAAIDFLLEKPELSGVFNATAPNATSNSQWTRLLGEQLGKSTPFTTPAFVLRLLFGEMADLLLFGQNVYPKRLLEAGFQFKFNQLRAALADLKL